MNGLLNSIDNIFKRKEINYKNQLKKYPEKNKNVPNNFRNNKSIIKFLKVYIRTNKALWNNIDDFAHCSRNDIIPFLNLLDFCFKQIINNNFYYKHTFYN